MGLIFQQRDNFRQVAPVHALILFGELKAYGRKTITKHFQRVLDKRMNTVGRLKKHKRMGLFLFHFEETLPAPGFARGKTLEGEGGPREPRQD